MKEEEKIVEENIGAGDLTKKDLTFLDGVIITNRIYNQILQKQLTNEKGELERDKNNYDHLGIIQDKIHDVLHDQVLMPYINEYGSKLTDQFGIDF